MKISELFHRNVTRDIPPVVYFHEQTPARLADEVSEYIITGGYKEEDPRHKRVPSGIHEQYVRLLSGIARELTKPGGPELPASWISGFYGSGKSSFAKLLGLALDGAKLPSGTTLADALLSRDDSQKRDELVKAWKAVSEKLDPIAVVFDIGGEAEDDEHIHSAVNRLVQRRLGYSRDALIAHEELKLEKDGRYEDFLAAARTKLGRDWSEVRDSARVDEQFSLVMSALEPDLYAEGMSWFEIHAGSGRHQGLAPAETVRNLEWMLSRRAAGKTLFVVVDEVSQYVHQDDDRMVRLQSFVSELGQRLKGKAWLLATGQQKLEDAGSSAIGKLKDRFPPSLRVHLAPANIRDVVHRRLLKKHPEREEELRAHFRQHKSQLQLYAFDCDAINEEDFVEVYPMLPGHVDLLMDLTTSLRARSTRVQGDDYAIRGLLQLLGELFRDRKLADREVGELVTLDLIYEVQKTAFDADLQTAMHRIEQHKELANDEWAQRAAKAIALLELTAERRPVTDELVAKCLYRRLGDENPAHALKPALEKLRDLNLVGYSAKEGYRIQSSAGQEWQSEREIFNVGIEERSRLVREKLYDLMRDPERPRLKGRAFYWSSFFSDGRQQRDERLLNAGDEAAVTIDFRFLTNRAERATTEWVKKSSESQFEDRIVWVAGDSELTQTLTELGKARAMVAKYEPRKASLSPEKQKLLFDEQIRIEGLENKARHAVEAAFVEGDLYFRGQHEEARRHGNTFKTIMSAAGSARLAQLYTQHTDVAVTDKELEQLLQAELVGVSPKFLDGALGLLTQDGGRFLPTCQGPVPAAVLAYIQKHEGTTGSMLLQDFARPPFGFPVDVVRACVLALLRARKVKVTSEDGTVLTSPQDSGSREIFQQVTKLKRATLFPNRDESITPRDRSQMARFFQDRLSKELEPDDDALASAVFETFGPLREQLRRLEERFSQLPGRPALEEPLQKLGGALESCRRARYVEPTVRALKDALPTLNDGTALLQRMLTELSDDAVRAVRAAADVRDHHIRQLVRDEHAADVVDEVKQIESQLNARRPWVDLRSIDAALDKVRAQYRTRRTKILEEQEKRAEAIRTGLKLRSGFERLTPEEVHRVLRPIGLALVQTTPEAIAPTLYELRMDFHTKLEKATQEASDILDELIASKDEKPRVKVELNLRGREISDGAQLETVLKEIKERVTDQLARGHVVRLG